ncbi:HK97 family phage prohead protease [Pseudonocardia broussonetiae]|uniref:HK97 family phage prohead protease n=1 Tax=Pseudonocardia broussonetiae TaxID=2736640 RepID=A0A6M6JW24_9PSEU|nr:HK97 family phage prohead protease [Pseudonocardia broussonetiae]QJY51257.1 HK97 family phage prohead protease [Pseudonocardia broussonetiae]
MSADLIRSFTPDLQIRSAAKGGDGRTVEGIAVPYARPQRIDSTLVEQFARGAFAHQLRAPNRVRFTREHMVHGGALIGRAIELRDDAAGLWGAWRVSATPAGDETLTLLEDGVLDELSIGFRARQDRRLEDGTIERVRADLVEVSVVLAGAYGRGALVSAVREAVHDELPDAPVCTCGAANRAAQAAQILAGLPTLPVA